MHKIIRQISFTDPIRLFCWPFNCNNLHIAIVSDLFVNRTELKSENFQKKSIFRENQIPTTDFVHRIFFNSVVHDDF